MDRIMSKLTERLAEQSSRGGFIATLGKLASGLAVVLVSGAGLADEAAAASLKCCGGTACSSTAGYNGQNGCPPAYGGCCVYVGYTWQCGGQGKFYCHDCYTYPANSTCPGNPTNGGYYCTYQDTSPTATIAC